MKTPQVMAWAEALRSGTYPQHHGRRAMRWNGNYSAYGVLTAICPGWYTSSQPRPSGHVYRWALGGEFMAWQNLYLDLPADVTTRSGVTLAHVEMRDLNKMLPFDQIGDLIEHFGVRREAI